MPISKRLRYEVLRRDNHACRYCGASAPGARLTVDHVVPATLGGSSEPGNLVTACVDCNAGKSSSSPSETIVDDVSADALRWARAMIRASDYLLGQHRELGEVHGQFLARWNDWTCGFKKTNLPLDPGWRQSVDSLLAAGLPMELLHSCIDIAMARKNVTPDNTFRYMCGVAWHKVTELQEIARDILMADDDREVPGI